MNDPGIQSILREIVSILETQVWFQSFRFAEPEEDRGNHSDDSIGLLPVPEHVAPFDHTGVVIMHGYSRMELLTEVGGIAGMVKIPVCQNHKLEAARLASRAFKLSLKLGAPAGAPCIDQDMATFGFYEVAIHTTQSEGQWQSDDCDISRH